MQIKQPHQCFLFCFLAAHLDAGEARLAGDEAQPARALEQGARGSQRQGSPAPAPGPPPAQQQRRQQQPQMLVPRSQARVHALGTRALRAKLH